MEKASPCCIYMKRTSEEPFLCLRLMSPLFRLQKAFTPHFFFLFHLSFMFIKRVTKVMPT